MIRRKTQFNETTNHHLLLSSHFFWYFHSVKIISISFHVYKPVFRGWKCNKKILTVEMVYWARKGGGVCYVKWVKILVFSSPELNALVSFSDHNLFVVNRNFLCRCCRKLFTFSFSFPELLGQFQANLA